MYIRVIPLHFKASMCQERERVSVRVGGRGRREGMERGGREVGSIAAVAVEPSLLSAAWLVAVAGLQVLTGADPDVVLCESNKSFKGL